LYGGDYNPEQWPEDVWRRDYELFDEAGIDTVTLGVFDWALTQPAPDVYDFTMLDRVVGRAIAQRRRICLATGTGAHPPWLAKAHPEVTRVDFEGRRRLLLRPVRGRVPRLAAGAVRVAGGAECRLVHHVLGARLHRLGRDRAAVGAHRALARARPHRVPGHHAGLPAVHVGRDARLLPRREGRHP
jgi:hypothetical protein